MFTQHITGVSKKGPSQALAESLKNGLRLARSVGYVDLILMNIVQVDGVWKAVIDVLGEYADEPCTHLYLESIYESSYREIASDFDIDYVHVIMSGSLWETTKTYHPDLALYEATHDFTRQPDQTVFTRADVSSPALKIGPLDKAQVENVFRTRETKRYDLEEVRRQHAKESAISFFINQGLLDEFAHVNWDPDAQAKALQTKHNLDLDSGVALEPLPAYTYK